MKTVRYLIVNADDFGVTPEVCAGIRRAHGEGIVTTTTAMMNLDGTRAELVRTRREAPGLGAGVHLNLTAGKPLLQAGEVPSLVDEGGWFLRPQALAARQEKISPDGVERDWRAQVAAYLGTSCRLDHLDSHHYTSSMNPELFARMLRPTQEFGCAIRPALAADEEVSQVPNAQREEAGLFMRAGARQAARAAGVRQADRRHVAFHDQGATLETLLSILERIPEGVSEIMCHPGEVDEPLRARSRCCEPRARELALLTSGEGRRMAIERGLSLVRYVDLPEV